jgi:hypothetical protein
VPIRPSWWDSSCVIGTEGARSLLIGRQEVHGCRSPGTPCWSPADRDRWLRALRRGGVLRLIGPACVYGQVLKTRRNDRVVRVDRRVRIGTARRLKDALLRSEDSQTLNTSFVERLNLTIRQGSAYLRRRTPCHARCQDQLRGHVELVRCYYNFMRPHRSLKFGRETRTPAMQAGLASPRGGQNGTRNR